MTTSAYLSHIAHISDKRRAIDGPAHQIIVS